MTEEKQIEEMARFMCANYDGEKGICGDGMECDHDCWAYREATHLYTAGYRKQSEVVRCKDCAHYIEMKGYDYNGRKARSCVWHSQSRRENDFCSDAIRKGGAE